MTAPVIDTLSGAQVKKLGFVARTRESLFGKIHANWQSIVVAIPFIWLLFFFLSPFFIVFKISIAESLIASPPFSSLFDWTEEGMVTVRVIFDNFLYLVEDELYLDTYLSSIKISSISTLICLFLGYPIAYAIIRSPDTTRHILLLLIILPFWVVYPEVCNLFL